MIEDQYTLIEHSQYCTIILCRTLDYTLIEQIHTLQNLFIIYIGLLENPTSHIWCL